MEPPHEDISGNSQESEQLDEIYRKMMIDLEEKREQYPNLISVWKSHIMDRRLKFMSELYRCQLLIEAMDNGTMDDLSLSQITRLVCLMHIINTGNNT